MPVYALGDDTPQLAPDCWVAPDAVLIGQVRLGAEASVWFGAVLRADDGVIAIGARSNVQDNCVLHVDPGFPLEIGEDCTIGHNATVHGCTIGAGSLVGMGATVLNGAKVGRNCIIGAGSLVAEHKVIPDNSLVVGVPGRVVRQLDDAAVAGLAQAADHYVRRARRYREGLKPAMETRP